MPSLHQPDDRAKAVDSAKAVDPVTVHNASILALQTAGAPDGALVTYMVLLQITGPEGGVLEIIWLQIAAVRAANVVTIRRHLDALCKVGACRPGNVIDGGRTYEVLAPGVIQAPAVETTKMSPSPPENWAQPQVGETLREAFDRCNTRGGAAGDVQSRLTPGEPTKMSGTPFALTLNVNQPTSSKRLNVERLEMRGQENVFNEQHPASPAGSLEVWELASAKACGWGRKIRDETLFPWMLLDAAHAVLTGKVSEAEVASLIDSSVRAFTEGTNANGAQAARRAPTRGYIFAARIADVLMRPLRKPTILRPLIESAGCKWDKRWTKARDPPWGPIQPR